MYQVPSLLNRCGDRGIQNISRSASGSDVGVGLRAAFQMFDRDLSGTIDLQELCRCEFMSSKSMKGAECCASSCKTQRRHLMALRASHLCKAEVALRNPALSSRCLPDPSMPTLPGSEEKL